MWHAHHTCLHSSYMYVRHSGHYTYLARHGIVVVILSLVGQSPHQTLQGRDRSHEPEPIRLTLSRRRTVGTMWSKWRTPKVVSPPSITRGMKILSTWYIYCVASASAWRLHAISLRTRCRNALLPEVLLDGYCNIIRGEQGHASLSESLSRHGQLF